MNLFSLHGKYFSDDENRLTANLLFFLSESRTRLLADIMKSFLQLPASRSHLSKAEITLQHRFGPGAGADRPDGVLRLGDEFAVVGEAKVRANPPTRGQLERYARHLAQLPTRHKRLWVITLIDESAALDKIRSHLEPAVLPAGSIVGTRWYEVMARMRSVFGLTRPEAARIEGEVRKGLGVDYLQRLAMLFLAEAQAAVYQRMEIADQPVGDVADAVLAVQRPWFMDVARRHRVWFPSGSLAYGQRPAKYVAYYETADAGNANPKSIGSIAENVIWWNRITLDDAKRLPELQDLFADKAVADEIDSWPWSPDWHTFHVVVTREPIKLRNPIPLGQKPAVILPKRRCSLTDLINASSIDDLL